MHTKLEDIFHDIHQKTQQNKTPNKIKITGAVKKVGKYWENKLNVLLSAFTGKAETLWNGSSGICE